MLNRPTYTYLESCLGDTKRKTSHENYVVCVYVCESPCLYMYTYICIKTFWVEMEIHECCYWESEMAG